MPYAQARPGPAATYADRHVHTQPPDGYGGQTTYTGLGWAAVRRYLDGYPLPDGVDADTLAHHVCGLAVGILRADHGIDLDADLYGVDGPDGAVWHVATLDGRAAYGHVLDAVALAVTTLADGLHATADGPAWQHRARQAARHAHGLQDAACAVAAARESGRAL